MSCCVAGAHDLESLAFGLDGQLSAEWSRCVGCCEINKQLLPSS